MATTERASIAVGEHEVGATTYPPSGARAAAPVLVLAHGAGASQSSAFMVDAARALAARGVEVTTFDFVYTARGKRAPDKPDLLEACWRAVLASVRARTDARPLFIGGKSMGGRIASQIAPREEGLAGLVFLGYPLHPPGKPTQLRAKHLPEVKAPMLFVQGTRDAFGAPDELRPLLAKLARGSELYEVAHGDHSFHVPKKAGTPEDAVLAAIYDHVARWVVARARGT